MWQPFADLHTHTLYSHGQGTVQDNIRAAQKRGLRIIGISDHGPRMLFGLGVNRPETLLHIKEETRRLAGEFPGISILTGVEANVIGTDGRLDVPSSVLRQLDYVMAGLHLEIIPASLGDGRKIILDNALGARLSHRVARRARVENTKALVEAIHKNDIDIITHPGLQLSIDTWELARAAAVRGTALEINAGHRQMTLEFVLLAHRAGARFVLGSDAHRPDRVGRLDYAVEVARKAGLSARDIINVAEEGEWDETANKILEHKGKGASTQPLQTLF
ncbi:MAG: PHP domain-containing protein [Firmicutes bacterium]|nr:PHP domain-containing protein [Bacillota bacterium]MCL5039958.1 PHP domain-containing protein [Bacillota bacterium]